MMWESQTTIASSIDSTFSSPNTPAPSSTEASSTTAVTEELTTVTATTTEMTIDETSIASILTTDVTETTAESPDVSISPVDAVPIPSPTAKSQAQTSHTSSFPESMGSLCLGIAVGVVLTVVISRTNQLMKRIKLH